MFSLSEKDVFKILKKCFGNEIQISGYEISPKSETPLGYLGNHFVLRVNLVTRGVQSKKNLFVKTLNGSDVSHEAKIFQKEVDFYRVLLENLKRTVDKPNWSAEFYYGDGKTLVLDDLSINGYEMARSEEMFDDNHVKVALKTLSSMHASFMVFEKKISNSLTCEYPNLFQEILYDENLPNGWTEGWIVKQTEDLLVGIDLLQKYSESEKAFIKSKFTKKIMRIYLLSKESQRYKNVLTHGDVWKNNWLFRYSSDLPLEGKLVDFQFFRYAPHAHDIMHFLYYNTKKNFRDINRIHLLGFYYDCLNKQLEKVDKALQNELTWNEFIESCFYYKELALIQCLLSLHYILGPVTFARENKNFKQIQRQNYMILFFSKESYRTKITEILVELIDDYIISIQS